MRHHCRRSWLAAAWLAVAMAGGMVGGQAALAADAEEVAVHITGRLLEVNGHATIPDALFGVHAFRTDQQRIHDWGVRMRRFMHATPHGNPTTIADRPEQAGLAMVIDCIADRYHPATVLTDPDYEAFFERRGREVARRLAEADEDHDAVIEFWNEPFLNWASRPGVNYDPRFYEVDEAEEGAPMRIRGREQALEHLVWSKQVRTVDAQSGRTNHMAYLAHSHIGHRRGEGEAFEFRGRTYRNERMWWGRDPTQTSWYSGRQNQEFYDRMFIPFARAIKQANPEVTVIGGWDFNFDIDDWDFWRTLYKPTIDNAIQYMDGITEHHYYVGAEKIPAWYEVAVAYTVTEHDKWVRIYNTETGGFIDAQIPGNEAVADADQDDPLRRSLRTFTYHTREVAHLLHLMPDKAAARSKHGEAQDDVPMSGEEAFFRFYKPLRGDLVEVDHEQRHLHPVAAVDGDRLIVIVFNDHGQQGRTLRMRVDAPQGTQLAGGIRTRVEIDGQERTLALVDEAVEAAGDGVEWVVDVPSRTAVRYVFDLKGAAPQQPQVVRRQFFAPGILHEVGVDEPLELAFDVDGEHLASAESARLRLVLEKVEGQSVAVRLNGEPIDVHQANMLADTVIPVALLAERNELVFEVVEGGKPFRVNTASVLVDAGR